MSEAGERLASSGGEYVSGAVERGSDVESSAPGRSVLEGQASRRQGLSDYRAEPTVLIDLEEGVL